MKIENHATYKTIEQTFHEIKEEEPIYLVHINIS